MTEALSQGVDDPELLVDAGWTSEQKRRWKAQFRVHLRDLRAREADEREARLNRGAEAMLLRRESVPVVSDVAEGLRQGAGGLASMFLLVAESTPLAAPAAGQERLADTIRRTLRERERVYAASGRGGAMGCLQWLARSPLFLPCVALSLYLFVRARQARRASAPQGDLASPGVRPSASPATPAQQGPPRAWRELLDDALAFVGRGKRYACALCTRPLGRPDDTCVDCERTLSQLDERSRSRLRGSPS